MMEAKRRLHAAPASFMRVSVSALVETPGSWILPTLSTLAFNATQVPRISQPAALPAMPWTQRERHAMMDRSEDRLRAIETKGPGLAAITAVIAAGVLVAINSAWQDGCWSAQLALGLAAFYALSSLGLPLYLVGPQLRHTIGEQELVAATASQDPEEELARKAAYAAAENDRRNLLLNNLQVAARREASYAVVLLLVWAIVVPITGLLAI